MFHVKHYLPKKTNNTETSLGETPDILDACPMVFGEIAVNFSTASALRLFSLLYSKSAGILTVSNFSAFLATSFSLDLYLCLLLYKYWKF